MFENLINKIKSFFSNSDKSKIEIKLNDSITFDLRTILILSDHNIERSQTLSLILKDYKQSGIVTKMIKESFNENSASYKCFFDNELESFIQINIIDNKIDSATTFKRYERIFYNKSKELFIDKNGDEYLEETWSNDIIGDNLFFIEKDENRFEYDRVFSSKEVYSTNIKSSNNETNVNIEECLYQRGVDNEFINRELVLVSHIETNQEKSINIYVGLDVPLTYLKINNEKK